MKRKHYFSPLYFYPIILGGFIASSVTGCTSTPAATLQSIKTEGDVHDYYHVGDTFVRPTVYAYYSNGSHKDVTLLAKFGGFSLNRAGDQTVTITYDTFSYEYSIRVVNEVNSLLVTGQRTSFELNEEFSLGGGHAYLVYDDESREEVGLEFLSVSGFDSSSIKDDGVVTLTPMVYTDVTPFTYGYKIVSSVEEEITSLEFSDVKTEYEIGEDFVRPTATANGSIDVTDLVTYEYDLSSIGTKTVTGTYKGFSNTFEVTVSSSSGIVPADIPADTISKTFAISTEDGEFTSENNVYTITKVGTYAVSGKLAEGQIVVNVPESEDVAEDDDVVVIELSNASISCTTGCPIHVIDCRDVEISAKKKTNNYLYDHSSLKDSTNDPYGAAIYVENGDLKLKGTGGLVCISTNNNGIHGKDDIKLQKLSLAVKAVNNGIKGNDSLKITEGANIDIYCGDDGLKTSNTSISNSGKQKGNIEVSASSLIINSYADGIDAAYDAIISTESLIEIHTNVYANYSDSKIPSDNYTKATSVKASDSAKGIKACNEVNISGGTISLETYDDGIHGNATSDDAQIVFENGENAPGNVTISGGILTVSATDDGVHADGTLTISGEADITVTKAYEGLEGHIINISGGKAVVSANDDGVNATSSGSWSSDGEINISGGYLDVTVPGSGDVDGIDSNGSYTQTGGVVVVRGPANGGAWSLDTDGDVNLNGGTLIVVGGIEASPSSGGGGGGGGHWYLKASRPGPGGPGGGGMGGGKLNVGSNMTKTPETGTLTTGKSKGTYQVTCGSTLVATYTNTSNYSSGSVIIYSELGSATIVKL